MTYEGEAKTYNPPPPPPAKPKPVYKPSYEPRAYESKTKEVVVKKKDAPKPGKVYYKPVENTPKPKVYYKPHPEEKAGPIYYKPIES